MTKQPIIVFDLDGTLVDSAPDLLDSLNYCLTQFKFQTFATQDMRRLVGMGGRIMIERALTLQNVALDDNKINMLLDVFLKHYEDTMPGHTRFFDGCLQGLQRLSDAGFILAVCTNKHENLARRLLQGLGEIGRFKAITGGDTFAYRKPDGRHIISTIEQADGDFTKAVMIGDSRADILAAQSVDIPVIAVDFGYTDQAVQTFNPTKVISNYDMLTVDLVKQLIV